MNWSAHFSPNHRPQTNQAWLSGHYFYTSPLSPFLFEGILPWVRYLQDRRLIDQYFFIRYAERGPHVRLRMLGTPHRLIETVVPYLEQQAINWFARYPSPPVDNAPSDWLPTNSLAWIAYEPEVERYGGLLAIDLAERHFEASSEAVFGAMQSPDQTYNRAMGIAIQLHAAYSARLLPDKFQRLQFWEMQTHNWAYYTILSSSQPATDEAFETLYRRFSQTFERQVGQLIPFFKDLWTTLTHHPVDIDAPWFTTWLTHLDELSTTLPVVAPLEPASLNTQFASDVAIDGTAMLLHSYVHMTNNRLGIFNYDEAYLGYIMQRLLRTL